jgi:hypothetical protein
MLLTDWRTSILSEVLIWMLWKVVKFYNFSFIDTLKYSTNFAFWTYDWHVKTCKACLGLILEYTIRNSAIDNKTEIKPVLFDC